MFIKTIAAITLTVTSGVAVNELSDRIKPDSERGAATATFKLLADAAYIATELGDEWPAALQTAAAEARNNEAVTVEGTTIYWRHGDACLYAELPTRDTVVEVKSC